MHTFYFNNLLILFLMYTQILLQLFKILYKFNSKKIKNKYIHRLEANYRDFYMKRFNAIILNYEFFIYENEEILNDFCRKNKSKI